MCVRQAPAFMLSRMPRPFLETPPSNEQVNAEIGQTAVEQIQFLFVWWLSPPFPATVQQQYPVFDSKPSNVLCLSLSPDGLCQISFANNMRLFLQLARDVTVVPSGMGHFRALHEDLRESACRGNIWVLMRALEEARYVGMIWEGRRVTARRVPIFCCVMHDAHRMRCLL